MSTAARNVLDQLTKLTPIGSFPSDVPEYTVAFFNDPWWSSTRWNADIRNWTSGDRTYVASSVIDKTTWVAWNLPIGYVVTLTDHYRARDKNKSVGLLDGLGASVDLVGTGKLETTDLRNCSMNDGVATFFWRYVDLRYGAVELFKDPNFTGGRVTLFLNEWSPNTVFNLPGWDINDQMSSIRWRSLVEKQKVTFYEHPDGRGQPFTRAKGWGTSKEVSNLRAEDNFDDKVSSFEWAPLTPVKEVITPFKIDPPQSNQTSISGQETYLNDTSSPQKFTVSFNRSETEGLTVSTTETHVAGVNASVTTSVSGGVPGVGEASAEYTMGVSYEYTNSKTTETAKSKETSINVTREVTADPNGTTTATMVVTVGNVPEKTYTTPATRWYTEQVPGSIPDGSWYKRSEQATVTVSGGLALRCNMTAKFQPK